MESRRLETEGELLVLGLHRSTIGVNLGRCCADPVQFRPMATAQAAISSQGRQGPRFSGAVSCWRGPASCPSRRAPRAPGIAAILRLLGGLVKLCCCRRRRLREANDLAEYPNVSFSVERPDGFFPRRWATRR